MKGNMERKMKKMKKVKVKVMKVKNEREKEDVERKSEEKGQKMSNQPRKLPFSAVIPKAWSWYQRVAALLLG